MNALQVAIARARVAFPRTESFRELEARAAQLQVQTQACQERITELEAEHGRLHQQLQAASACLAVQHAGRPTIAAIKRHVGIKYNISAVDMDSRRRTKQVAHVRQIAMYLAKELTHHSLPEIGRRFGPRDHTTVLWGVRKIAALRQTDTELDSELRVLQQEIAAVRVAEQETAAPADA